LRDLPHIRAFKIVQETVDFTRVLVVSENRLSPTISQAVERGFKARLGEGVTVDVQEVPEIPAEQSGKFRYVISKAI
jgi:phenylacetate-CoA ligase